MKYITKENIHKIKHNGKIVNKRLCNYIIHPDFYWCKTKSESIYCIEHDIYEQPKCKQCQKETKYLSPKQGGYQTFCSNKCSNNNLDIKMKQINYDHKKLGKKISEKAKLRSEEEKQNIKLKREETCFEKYGDKNFNNREKFRKTNLEKYGFENPMQNEKIKEKTRKTQYKKYGGYFNPEQFVKTNLEKYGCKYPLQNKEEALRFSKFLARKYSNNDYKKGFLYIIYFPNLDLVKIGITIDINKRKKALIRDFGEFDIIKIKYYDNCSIEESKLHKKYDKYNIILEKGAGRTEFFLKDVLENI